MKKVILKRIFHREKWIYAISTGYDSALYTIAKNIDKAAYSSTHKCWYTEATEGNLRNILAAFRDKAFVDISAISSSIPHDEDDDQAHVQGNKTIVSIEEKPIHSDPDFPSVPDLDPVEFRISESTGRLIVRFTGRYDKDWIEELKSYGKLYYDKVHREFYLAWSKITVDSLSDYFSNEGVRVQIVRPEILPGTKELRRNFSDEIRSRDVTAEGMKAMEVLRKHLLRRRYSRRTSEAYIAVFGLFLRYFNDKNPEMITEEEISRFMNEFIIRNGFSPSYQNQVVSAIKLYYALSGRSKVVPEHLERPRRSRALPKVFSKDEVERILNSVRNGKHKLLLCMIYSCGLRRSEVINIRLIDIDRTRNIIHIREGKGGVDRIVPVPDKLWPRLNEYIDSFTPREYLFEGQTGGKYSPESVYNVFKKALHAAGIRKDVGVHSLRHSYATHLHENGLDIRYIQELLGHKSTRTTEIYTHVSRRNLAAIRSPLDDLDLK